MICHTLREANVGWSVRRHIRCDRLLRIWICPKSKRYMKQHRRRPLSLYGNIRTRKLLSEILMHLMTIENIYGKRAYMLEQQAGPNKLRTFNLGIRR
jgi:hypothetical protein